MYHRILRETSITLASAIGEGGLRSNTDEVFSVGEEVMFASVSPQAVSAQRSDADKNNAISFFIIKTSFSFLYI